MGRETPERGDQVRLEGRERRIAHGDIDAPGVGVQVVQMAGVVARRRGRGEQAGQEIRPAFAAFVQDEGPAAGLGDDRHQAGAGGGFEHAISVADLGGEERHPGELGRRGELIERDLLLASTTVGEPERSDPGQQGHDLRRGVFQPRHLRAQPADLKHRRRLDRVIGVAPGPGTLGVGGAEGGGEDRRDEASIQRARAGELGRQGPRRREGVG